MVSRLHITHILTTAIVAAVALAVLLLPRLAFAAETDVCQLSLSSANLYNCTTYVLAVIAEGILSLMGHVLWLAGLALNEAVITTVIQMGKNVQNIGAIDAGWVIFRDLGNIALIFLMLAIGISTILQIQSYGIKQLLAKLIIVALLLNFSLFFTKLIVDSSNLLAIQFWSQMSIEGTNDGISNSFMSALQLTSLYSTKESPNSIFAGRDEKGKPVSIGSEIRAGNLSMGKIFAIGILGSVLILVTAFVFFAAAFLLVTRFVLLVLLMMLAPLAFIAMIAPLTSGYAKQWWETLLKQSFFAPAYFALTWAALKVLESKQFKDTIQSREDAAGAFGNLIGGDSGSIAVLLQFLIVIVLICASLIIANKLGAYGSGSLINFGVKLRRGAQGIAGRNTVGLAARGAGKGYKYGAALAQGAYQKSGLSRVPLVGSFIGGAGKAVDSTIARGLKSGEEAKFGSSASYAQRVEEREKRDKALSQKRTDIENQRAAERLAKGSGTAEDISRMNKLTKRELEKLDSSVLASANVAKHLSASQLDAVKKSDEFSEEEATRIVDARFADIMHDFNESSEGTPSYKAARKALRNFSDKELEMLSETTLQKQKVIKELKQSQLDAIQKSDKISAETKDRIKAVKKRQVGETLEYGTAQEIDDMLGGMSASAVAKLDDDHFDQDALIKRITPQIAVEMNKEKGIGIKKKVAEAAKKAMNTNTATEEQEQLYKWMTEDSTKSPAGILFAQVQ